MPRQGGGLVSAAWLAGVGAATGLHHIATEKLAYGMGPIVGVLVALVGLGDEGLGAPAADVWAGYADAHGCCWVSETWGWRDLPVVVGFEMGVGASR